MTQGKADPCQRVIRLNIGLPCIERAGGQSTVGCETNIGCVSLHVLEVNLGCPRKKSVSCPAGGRNWGQWAAAILDFLHFFVCLVGKYCPFLGEKKDFFFCKNEKKVSRRTFFRHPAAPPETYIFILDWPWAQFPLKAKLPVQRRLNMDYSVQDQNGYISVCTEFIIS